VGGNFLVVVFRDLELRESMTLVKPFRVVVGNLDVKVDPVDLGFCLGSGVVDDELEGL